MILNKSNKKHRVMIYGTTIIVLYTCYTLETSYVNNIKNDDWMKKKIDTCFFQYDKNFGNTFLFITKYIYFF